MKRFLYLNSTVVVVSLILSACNAPVGSDVTAGDATELPATVTETAVVEASPTLVSIDLAGPPMEIGSKYPYVDGTILVAVPGGTFIMGYQGEDNPV
ncbi:MAG: hypothetical protein H7Y59_13975, partial [Anaerolineales bacterium]|nr:hypothetical protein [Anaerolineales bacterium]